MKIKWYWLAEKLGLMRELTDLYQDGQEYYEVSARADEVFFRLALAMIALLFFLGLVIRFFTAVRNREKTGKNILLWCVGIMLLYAVLLAVGVGPYIQFYPKSGGFVDFSVLEHIFEGVYWCILAASTYFGGRLGYFLAVPYGKSKK